MKKIVCFIMMIVCVLSLSACGDKSETQNAGANNQIDVDLTQLSNTMVYSEVYNMMSNPDSYNGKTIKAKGPFSVYQDPSSEKIYYAVIIADATSCCSQGIEFELSGEYAYPDDYPEQGTEITVTGIFHTYTEDQNTYINLVDAEMES